MNAPIAELLKLRLQGFSYVEKLAGLVRAITYERAGQNITIPVAANVEDPLQCDDAVLRDLVPDQAYKTIVYFEDRGLIPIKSRTRGMSYVSNLRLVCWLNTAKLGGDVNAGDAVLQKFLLAIHKGPYNMGPFIGIKHRVVGIPTKGPTLFSAYTYPEGTRQYLIPPFDAFGVDITTEFRIKAGCEDEVSGENVECWTPPATERKKHPREFTCEELNDPINGLTAEQLTDCLDCSGMGPVDPCPLAITVNGDEIASVTDACDSPTVALTVKDQDGNILAVTFDGNSIVVTMANPLFHVANLAAAQADNSTVLTAQQLLVIDDTGATYAGPGDDTPAARITAGKHTLGVVDGDPVITKLPGGTFEVQLNPQ